MIDNSVSYQIASKTGFRERIESLIPKVLSEQHSFALWFDNRSGKHNLLVHLGEPALVDNFEVEDSAPGFLISSFEGGSKSFLQADILINSEDLEIKKSNSLSAEKKEKLEDLLNSNNKYPSKNKRQPAFHLSNPSGKTEDEDYLKLVTKGLQFIKDGKLEKIVPARKTSVPTKNCYPVDLYFKLVEKYPRAFTYLVSVKGTGTWVGATPERLIRVQETKYFETDSLAGTQPNKPDLKLAEVSWTQKEIEEQALVSRYIINCFKQIRLREFEEHGPKTVVAGNLLHLKTSFKVDMDSANFQGLGTVMLKLLHPTSAVCGMPREESLHFLKEHENLDRRLFSGYLGPVNIEEETAIYVNLRCMEYHGETSSLYAGAGVTEDSDPEKELEETELKFNTILEVLEHIS